ncbi:MAG: hypothetical protein CTR54_08280 [Rhizobium sp.]|nr:MAG: hypothetical protein CTR54_08280 [Rhizobium sp.]
MKTRIRASMARTGEDLGLALRRALAGEVMRRVARQTEQRAAGQTPGAPVAGGGASVAKARSDVKESEGRP